ncbi:MAG: recombinase family protein [Thermoplasmata archaeon]
MTVAIYARVSTEDQDLQGQLRELRRYARAREWPIEEEYVEKMTGTGRIQRREWERLRRDARLRSERRFDRVLVWSLDRWSRDPKFTAAIGSIEELEAIGVKFHSLREPTLDSPEDGAPSIGRELLRAILPVIAGFETSRLSERTQLAMDEIKSGRRRTRSGRPPGRPVRMTPEVAARVRRLRDIDHLPWKTIAQYVHMPAGSCSKVPKAVSGNGVSGNGVPFPVGLDANQGPPIPNGTKPQEEPRMNESKKEGEPEP